MKIKTVCSCVVTVLLITLFTSGCFWSRKTTPFPYEFRQSPENIQKVEICLFEEKHAYGNLDTITPLVQLPDNRISEFQNDMTGLECGTSSKYDPSLYFGDLLFVITYRDGEKELLGFAKLGYITPDGTGHCTLDFLRNRSELCKIFLKYADKETLLEVSTTFTNWYDQMEDNSN